MKTKLSLTAIIMLFFLSVASAQTGGNLYQDAITLYKWKTNPSSTNTDNIGIILKKFIMKSGDPTVHNGIIDSLNNIFLIRSYAQQLKNNREKVYDKIMRYVEERKDVNSVTLNDVREKKNALENLNNQLYRLNKELNVISGYSLNGTDPVYIKINDEAKLKCQDSVSSPDSCLKVQASILVNAEKDKISNKIVELKTKISRSDKAFKNAIQLIGIDASAIQEIGLAKVTVDPAVVNEVLNDYRTKSEQQLQEEIKEYNINITNNSAQLTNKGMPSQSELIDAFSIYLAKRVKQEAMVFFMESMRNKFDTDRADAGMVRALKTLLPETSSKLLDWDRASPPNFDNSWKYSFSKDLISLPGNGIDYLETTPQVVNSKMKPLLPYLSDACLISDRIIKHYNFVQMAEYFGGDGQTPRLRSSEVQTFMTLIHIINQEMYKSKDSSNDKAQINFWLSSTEFMTNMRNNDDLMRIFMALLVNKYPKLSSCFNQMNLYALSATNVSELKGWLGNVLMTLQHFQERQALVKKDDKVMYNINSYWTALSEVMEVTLSMNENKRIIKTTDFLENGIKKVGQVFEVYQLIQDKNFGAASASCMALLSTYLEPGSEAMKEATHMISFISGILQSKDATQMAKVIESFALPPASYRLKQTSFFTVSLGAYFGPYAGAEFIKGKHEGAVVGFSAPITLDFNWRSGKNRRSYVTASLLMFDLGAVVSYRIKREEGGLPKEARWDQLFSPGANIRFGLGNSPLTLSFGGQLTPRLRSFDGGSGNDAIRISGGLLVDMPLLLIKKKESARRKVQKKSSVIIG
ncbi:hypothetical protein EZ456_07420 [Pedobacter psychrodurus]|uniref:Uncharacterized protein n=1 Tax=Pedobacter psychrodurus TaxID=2530456 RepID=A0A4R0Q2X4_9SPHI|nr:hypothetical protein [Pedobacter psychrodurus]TCD27770.1 hypothetical protein EZ456_07420 [Pedobacter psychrodurus]